MSDPTTGIDHIDASPSSTTMHHWLLGLGMIVIVSAGVVLVSVTNYEGDEPFAALFFAIGTYFVGRGLMTLGR